MFCLYVEPSLQPPDPLFKKRLLLGTLGDTSVIPVIENLKKAEHGDTLLIPALCYVLELPLEFVVIVGGGVTWRFLVCLFVYEIWSLYVALASLELLCKAGWSFAEMRLLLPPKYWN